VSTRAFNAACVGRRLDVLFDKPGRRPGQAGGRSPYLQAVHVDCGDDAATRALIGTLRPVAITAAGPNSLTGTLVGDAAVPPRPHSAPPMSTRSVPA
jgi:tRNA-2-methylthio-N6-dimethylallyladenosine synthase